MNSHRNFLSQVLFWYLSEVSIAIEGRHFRFVVLVISGKRWPGDTRAASQKYPLDSLPGRVRGGWRWRRWARTARPTHDAQDPPRESRERIMHEEEGSVRVERYASRIFSVRVSLSLFFLRAPTRCQPMRMHSDDCIPVLCTVSHDNRTDAKIATKTSSERSSSAASTRNNKPAAVSQRPTYVLSSPRH